MGLCLFWIFEFQRATPSDKMQLALKIERRQVWTSARGDQVLVKKGRLSVVFLEVSLSVMEELRARSLGGPTIQPVKSDVGGEPVTSES